MSNLVRNVVLGGVPVGPNYPTIFMPEIGVYFQQDIGQARESIAMVKEAGFEIIKGEVAHSAEIVLDDDFEYHYKTHLGNRSRRYREIIEEVVLPIKVWKQLYGLCNDLGLRTVISAYDPIAVDIVVDVGAACIKISTNNCVNIPLIRYAAKTGTPIMIDTGKANLEEVARAVDTARDAGCEDIIINHAPDGHPARPEDHHLRIIETYERAFGLPVGLADHHVSEEIMYAAAGMGYSLLEKPVVPDPKSVDVDATWTMRLDEMVEVKKKVQNCWEARGMTRRPHKFTAADHPARMGLVAACDVNPGDPVDETTVRYAWPLRGICVYDWDIVNGGKFNCSVKKSQPIKWEYVQPCSKP